jgi:hypothetical protein
MPFRAAFGSLEEPEAPGAGRGMDTSAPLYHVSVLAMSPSYTMLNHAWVGRVLKGKGHTPRRTGPRP